MASCPPIYAWADNIQHMDPCEVASSLMDVCDSSLPPLQPIINHEDTYRGPTTKLQSSCLCSSVIYALVSACSDCQGGLIESWPTWSTNCTSPLVDSFDGPLPANISVPAWAYFDVNSDPLYSPSAASSSAAALQATSTFTTASATAAEAVAAEILPTSTSTSQTTSTTLTKSGLISLATASFGSDLSSATTGNRTAAIVGGTIAAVVLLAMGAALAYWYMRRRRRTRVPPSAAYMALYGPVY